METTQPLLDQDDYLHLIANALKLDQWSQALSIGKEALINYPNFPQMQYIVGAIYAHDKEFDLAIDLLAQSLKNDIADPYPAAFQLGLIHITFGRLAEAKNAWQELNSLHSDHFFKLFSEGMQHLVANEFEQAQQKIELGVSKNTFFPSINEDMNTVLVKLQAVLPDTANGHKVSSHYAQLSNEDTF